MQLGLTKEDPITGAMKVLYPTDGGSTGSSGSAMQAESDDAGTGGSMNSESAPP